MEDDGINFAYQGLTAGHNLQPVIIGKLFEKKLKAHCKKHDCFPISYSRAVYDFVREDGFTRTLHSLNVTCAKGKGNVAAWFKATRIQWTFGSPPEIGPEYL